MKLRHKETVNYRQLNSGPKLQVSGRKAGSERWPSSKLWRCHIVDEREDEVKVTWEGWPTSYDQWIPKVDAVDVSDATESTDAYGHLKYQIYVQIQEHLNIARFSDSEVTIRIPVQKETYERFINDCGLKENTGICRVDESDRFEQVLGRNGGGESQMRQETMLRSILGL
ncbi:uncharacterized protein [Amphiura filiformis]|uniref:uncharacterized protein n=1 Tax=Amphiura filiformis TaxID=82378 RepID=UPI003B217CA1